MGTKARPRTSVDDGGGTPERFARICAAVAARLPFGLARVVPPTFVGFAAISGSTYGLDLLILYVLHGHGQLPYGLAVGIGYSIAFALSFVLNRVLNFRSHEPAGRQTLVYLGVVAVNLAILVGISSALEAVGVHYQVARIAAGAAEGLFMYCAMRWVVFPRTVRPGRPAAR
jgi:putative flippase GtrA